MPNPAPPGHKLKFVDDYQTPDDASLALAWTISGPMLDGGSCLTTLIDCNADEPGVVYPDPRNPLAAPAVACPARVNATNSTADNSTAANTTVPAVRQPVLRVYYGSSCQLWRENPYNCSWDNIKQR